MLQCLFFLQREHATILLLPPAPLLLCALAVPFFLFLSAKISSFQFSTSPTARIYPIAAKNVRLTKT